MISSRCQSVRMKGVPGPDAIGVAQDLLEEGDDPVGLGLVEEELRPAARHRADAPASGMRGSHPPTPVERAQPVPRA